MSLVNQPVEKYQKQYFGTNDMIEKVYFIQQVIITPVDIC